MLSSRFITVFLSAMIVLILGIFWHLGFFGRYIPKSTIGRVNISLEKKKWSDVISTLGFEKAYALFKQDDDSKNFVQQHSIAHLFGTLLYQKEGEKGLTVCDESFDSGCIHGFVSAAIADKGLDVISKFVEICDNKYIAISSSCKHSVGHGLMEFFTKDNLVSALEACKATNQKSKIFGCTEGVFMEYNRPPYTKFDANRPYAPCDKVPEEFQPSCYFKIGLRWLEIFGKDVVEAGLLCDKITSFSDRELCFLGVGRTLSSISGFDAKKLVDLCNKISVHDGKLLCRAGATWVLWHEPRSRVDFRDICADLSKTDHDYCMKKTDLLNEGQS